VDVEIKPVILDIIKRADAEADHFYASLSDEEKETKGKADHWAAKDILAHIASWNEVTNQRLDAAINNGEPPQDVDDFDQVNHEIFLRNADLTWPEVMEKIHASHAAMIEKVMKISDQQLSEIGYYPWLKDRPLWRRTVAIEYPHLISHFSQYYLDHDQKDKADALQEKGAQLIGALDDSPSWQGTIIYNLACYYAHSGQAVRAISGLKEALKLSPDLTDWSKKDPDFDSIREIPEYKALYS
jgi:hypothetical protein